jgi:predicted NBD/HSP70 family sugar kinase
VRLTGLLNPDLIVIGGDISAGRHLLESKIQPRVREKIKSLFRYDIPLPEIGFSEFGEFSVSMGAAAYVLSTVLKPVN